MQSQFQGFAGMGMLSSNADEPSGLTPSAPQLCELLDCHAEQRSFQRGWSLGLSFEPWHQSTTVIRVPI